MIDVQSGRRRNNESADRMSTKCSYSTSVLITFTELVARQPRNDKQSNRSGAEANLRRSVEPVENVYRTPLALELMRLLCGVYQHLHSIKRSNVTDSVESCTSLYEDFFNNIHVVYAASIV